MVKDVHLKKLKLKKTLPARFLNRVAQMENQNFLDISPEAIIIYAEGRIAYANNEAVKLAGARNHLDLIGKDISNFLKFEQIEKVTQRIEASLQGVKDSFCARTVDARGSVCYFECYFSPFIYQGSPASMIVVRDITERTQIEEEKLKSTKLEAISLLAGGIAHDFNNLLTIILGNLSIAKAYANNFSNIYGKLKEIENAALQTKELTEQLLLLSKGNSSVKHTTSIEELLTEMIRFALHGSNIDPVFRFAGNLPSVHIDTGQFGQVVNNLVINAVQAMQPEGGALRINVECVNIPHSSSSLAAGRYVKISFADQGCGMAPEVMDHIFEPFFTTKEQGSGLGLATSYNIIRQHNGAITVESELGRGTTFDIYLPAAESEGRLSSVEAGIRRGAGRILLMDDEYGVRKIAGEMLRYLGYEVDYAVNGEETINRYVREKQRGSGYDAVILDMTVRGGMGGQKTMEKLLQADPDVKAVISSGYTNAPLLSEYQKFGFQGFVFKPYRLEELSSVIYKTIMDASPEEVNESAQ